MFNGNGNDNQGISDWDLYHIAGPGAVVRRSINNALYNLAVGTVQLGARGLSAAASGVYHLATEGVAYIQEKAQAQPLPLQGTPLAKYYEDAGVEANYNSESDGDYVYTSSSSEEDDDNSPRPRRRR